MNRWCGQVRVFRAGGRSRAVDRRVRVGPIGHLRLTVTFITAAPTYLPGTRALEQGQLRRGRQRGGAATGVGADQHGGARVCVG